jgi:predicted transposase/invertase (TIGR01784 family)
MKEKTASKDPLDFTNDKIFKHVLSSDIDVCREFIRRINPDIDTEGIRYAETGHEIIVGVKEEKIVRFDILTRTDRSVTNLEMYRYKSDDFPKTGRYNAAMIDSELLKNHVPKDLADVTVILLCTYDPLGFGAPVYRIRSKVDGYPEYDYNEGREICIVTDRGFDKASEELKPIIWLLTRNEEPIDDPFYRKIQEMVEQARTDPEVRREIMLEIEKENAIRRDARKEGHKEGLEEGRKEGRKEGLEEGRKEERGEAVRKFVKKLRDMNLPEEEILKTLTDIYPDDEEMIREIMKAE